MQISQGSVDPNRAPNRAYGKGKPVNNPVLQAYAWQHKFVFRRFELSVDKSSFVTIIASVGSTVKVRTTLTIRRAVVNYCYAHAWSP